MSKPTPTPWRINDELSRLHHRYDDGTRVISSAEGDIAVCETTRGWDDDATSPANAAFIVRAVNAHADLVAALRQAKIEMWQGARADWTVEDFKNWAVVQQIDAALTKADGKKR